MRNADLIRLAFRAITASPLRSLLTTLGMLIGIASVVLLTSIGEGIHRFVLAEFTQFGTNLIAVAPGKTTTFGISGAAVSNVRPLSLADAQALDLLANVKAVVPLVQGNARVEYLGKARRTNIFGVSSAVPDVWRMKVASGRFLPDDDPRAARPFAVLGNKLRKELFGSVSPLGQPIRVGGDRYRVIGVMEEKGQMLGFDLDDTVFVPTARTLELFNRQSLMEIDLLFKSGVQAKQVSTSVKRLLMTRHGHEDFTIVTQQQMLETLDSVLNVLTLAVGALGGVSLVVGAVGILTIMTIAVSERVAEIGLLRAIGAEQGTILKLFLGEAVSLSFSGGAAGVLLGIIVVKSIGVFIPALPVQFAWIYIVSALLLALSIGLIAGVFPALRAARLKPLEALRTE